MKPDPTVQIGNNVMRKGELLTIRNHAKTINAFKVISVVETDSYPTTKQSDAVSI